jgi:hypothetical protein
MENLEQKSKEESNKTCVWFIIDKPYEPCPSCNKYNVDCPSYIPLEESEPARVARIMKNLYKPELKKRR